MGVGLHRVTQLVKGVSCLLVDTDRKELDDLCCFVCWCCVDTDKKAHFVDGLRNR